PLKVDAALDDLPELRNWIAERKLTRESAFFLTGNHNYPADFISLALTNVPFRTVMNRLSTEFGVRGWDIYHRKSSHGITISYN
ncbi:MAG: hypothetical protein WA660_12165, partial [Candidatus Acidiferrales bacterium]